jgi:hypothetical protein
MYRAVVTGKKTVRWQHRLTDLATTHVSAKFADSAQLKRYLHCRASTIQQTLYATVPPNAKQAMPPPTGQCNPGFASTKDLP